MSSRLKMHGFMNQMKAYKPGNKKNTKKHMFDLLATSNCNIANFMHNCIMHIACQMKASNRGNKGIGKEQMLDLFVISDDL